MAGESARQKYEELRQGRRQAARDNSLLLLVLALTAVVGGAIATRALFGIWWPGVLFALLPVLGATTGLSGAAATSHGLAPSSEGVPSRRGVWAWQVAPQS